jgi:hypothetical protein
LAIKNVQLEKGTLLDYNEVYLNEGAWPYEAYENAEERENNKGEPHKYDSPKTHAPWVSQGVYPQMLQPSETMQPSGEIAPLPPSFAPSNQPVPVETSPDSVAVPPAVPGTSAEGVPAFDSPASADM